MKLLPLLFLALGPLAASAHGATAVNSEITIETNAKKGKDGQNYTCVLRIVNGEDGGMDHLEKLCVDQEEPVSFTWDELASEEGVVAVQAGDRDVVWIRIEEGFDRHKDGFFSVTYLRNGISGDKGVARLHAYKVGDEWIGKLVEEKGETEVTKVCAPRKQFMGKTVGIDKVVPPGPDGSCSYKDSQAAG
jgi:hypothetical protein